MRLVIIVLVDVTGKFLFSNKIKYHPGHCFFSIKKSGMHSLYSLFCFSLMAFYTVHCQSVCPYSIGGFRVVLGSYNIGPSTGRATCQSYGWDYAIVSAQKINEAAWTVSNCTAQSVGLWSYGGFVGRFDVGNTQCQFMQGSGVFGVGLTGIDCSAAGELPVLCKDDNPVESLSSILSLTSTTSTSITITITSTSMTTTVTTTRQTMTSTVVVKRVEEDYKRCSDTQNGLHLLTGPYGDDEAEAACATFGLQLARLSSTDIPTVRQLWQSCQAATDPTAWIYSFDQVVSGRCRFLYKQGDAMMWLMVSGGELPCSLAISMVICKDPAVIGNTDGTDGLLSAGLQPPTSSVWSSTTSLTFTATSTSLSVTTATVTIRSTSTTRSTTTTTVTGNLLTSLISIIGGIL